MRDRGIQKKIIAMKIHLKQIPAEGLHLEGDEECPIPELVSEGIRCVGPLHYNLEVGTSGTALWANGTLSQPLELTCVVCLEPFEFTIHVPSFAMHTELAGPEVVDVTPWIREDILLNLPAYPHCDRDGGRVCKAQKTLFGNRKANEQNLDAPHSPVWSELDKLKVKH